MLLEVTREGSSRISLMTSAEYKTERIGETGEPWWMPMKMDSEGPIKSSTLTAAFRSDGKDTTHRTMGGLRSRPPIGHGRGGGG